MDIIFFSSDNDIVDEWKIKSDDYKYLDIYDTEVLEQTLSHTKDTIVIVDYDTMATDFNNLIAANKIPKYAIVLESVPEILTGKLLISHGVKGYGNSRMLLRHYKTLLEVVENGNVWTYPQLTASLVKRDDDLSIEALELLDHRVTQQEKKVVMAILEGFTNEAIAHQLGVTVRTVKFHISSIFSKLHVNGRVALILLLK